MKANTAILVFLALLLPTIANSAPLNVLDVSVSDNDVVSVDERLTSSIGAVVYDSSPGSTWPPILLGGFPNSYDVAGSADFGVLKVRSYASSHGGQDRFANTDADTSFQVQVNAAPVPPGGSTPGLSLGDNVSLSLSFRLDGTLRSGAAYGDTTGSGSLGATLRINDTSTIGVDCGSSDGCYTPRLLDFRANAYSASYGLADDVYVDQGWNSDLSTTSKVNPSVPIDPEGSIDQYLTSEQRDSYRHDYYTKGTSCLGGVTAGECGALNVAIEILSIELDTTVGATLDISASLDAFSQAWNDAYGSVDFLNTYGLVLVALTDGVELVYLDGITPAAFDLGGSAVPIPAAVWLFGTALIGLVGFSKRRKAA